MSAFTDIVKLADKNNGKIPDCIPAHYVAWAYQEHRESKGLYIPLREYRDSMRFGCISLKGN